VEENDTGALQRQKSGRENSPTMAENAFRSPLILDFLDDEFFMESRPRLMSRSEFVKRDRGVSDVTDGYTMSPGGNMEEELIQPMQDHLDSIFNQNFIQFSKPQTSVSPYT
jgi:hypothetical protein